MISTHTLVKEYIPFYFFVNCKKYFLELWDSHKQIEHNGITVNARLNSKESHKTVNKRLNSKESHANKYHTVYCYNICIS